MKTKNTLKSTPKKMSKNASKKDTSKDVLMTPEKVNVKLSSDEIRALYHTIKASAKNINSIAKLISALKGHITKKSFQEVECRLLLVSLHKIFEQLVTSKLLRKRVKESEGNKFILNQWLMAKYNDFKESLLSILITCEQDTDVIVDVVEIYLELVKLETDKWGPKEPYFPSQMFEELVNAIMVESGSGGIDDGGTNNGLALDFLNSQYLCKFKDLKYYFLSSVLALVEKQTPQNYGLFYSRWLTVMRKDYFKSVLYGPEGADESESDSDSELELEEEKSDDDKEDVDGDTFVTNPPQSSQKYAAFRALFTKCWLLILSKPGIQESQLKTTLLILHKRIIPYINFPEQMMDFLTSCYNTDSLIIQILALNSLFYLMQRHNLEYQSFYKKLYEVLKHPEILTNRYRSRFFRMVDLFLSSTHLSAALVGSFIKIMAKQAVTSNPGGIVIVIPLVYNLLRKHPSCMIMIHNITDSEDYVDPFNSREADPRLTNAMDSSLWELLTLSNHYHPNIATLAKIFQNPFTKASYNMEDFLDWNYSQLVDSEITRKAKESMMATEFEEWGKVFGDYINWGL